MISGSLSTDDYCCFSVLSVPSHEVSVTEAWSQFGVGRSWCQDEKPWDIMLINSHWGWEFTGGPASLTQHSHHKGSDPTSGQRTKILQAVLCKKQTNKVNKQNQRQIVKTKRNINNNKWTSSPYPMDCRSQGSSVHAIFKATILE